MAMKAASRRYFVAGQARSTHTLPAIAEVLGAQYRKRVNVGILAFSRKYPNVYALPELRSQTRDTRYRLPGVSVLLAWPATKYLLDAPFIAIEILSEDDRMSAVIEKLKEYAAKGAPHIWLIDPRLKQMFTFRQNCLAEVDTTLATENPHLELTRDEVFTE